MSGHQGDSSVCAWPEARGDSSDLAATAGLTSWWQLGWWGSSMVSEAKTSPLFIVGNECRTVQKSCLPPRPMK